MEPAKVFFLAQQVDTESLKAVLQLLQDVQDGLVVGFAYAAIQRGRAYSADVVGEARKDPDMAARVVLKLQERLAEVVTPEK